jgi:hypothetical protein
MRQADTSRAAPRIAGQPLETTEETHASKQLRISIGNQIGRPAAEKARKAITRARTMFRIGTNMLAKG